MLTLSSGKGGRIWGDLGELGQASGGVHAGRGEEDPWFLRTLQCCYGRGSGVWGCLRSCEPSLSPQRGGGVSFFFPALRNRPFFTCLPIPPVFTGGLNLSFPYTTLSGIDWVCELKHLSGCLRGKLGWNSMLVKIPLLVILESNFLKAGGNAERFPIQNFIKASLIQRLLLFIVLH